MTAQQPGEATLAALSGRELIKGHGAGNDFLLLIDPDCQVSLSASDVAAVCNRHTGIGADGFVRVVHTAALPGSEAFAAAMPEAKWFMDYYNADGSVARTCGNASWLFAHVLDAEGLCQLPDGASITIGTRGGARTITRTGQLWAVDMGPAALTRPDGAVADVNLEGWDTLVEVPGLEGQRAALSINMPNPHTVVALADEAELDTVNFAGLTDSDTLELLPVPYEGTNLEVVVPLGADEEDGVAVGRARVRILERGVGEAQSCGTGCCAVAVALHEWEGEDAPQDYLLEVPGGSVGVHVGADPWAPGATVLLTGPTQIIGRISLA
ncbi:diaminopimelate epimerase [Actinomyces trachealis]|uniref:diaminopimelate epimerase n=1 Tax=Actinomyces trachealis TaxID=2763540 RepID=UPI001892CC35|nr:diaminopimelate epimerase [Actinomyces trachealis]